MKKSFLPLTALTLALAGSAFADPGDRHFIFKATALLPVQIEKIDKKGEIIVSKVSLGTKELVNLATAQPVYEALDSKTEILAVDVNHDDENSSVLIVFNPTTESIVARIITLAAGGAPSVRGGTNSHSDKSKGTGLSPGSILATAPSFGAPAIALNSLGNTDICAAANGTWTPTEAGPKFTLSATGIIGDIKGIMTDKKDVTSALDGVVIKGMFTSSGKSIFRYTE